MMSRDFLSAVSKCVSGNYRGKLWTTREKAQLLGKMLISWSWGPQFNPRTQLKCKTRAALCTGGTLVLANKRLQPNLWVLGQREILPQSKRTEFLRMTPNVASGLHSYMHICAHTLILLHNPAQNHSWTHTHVHKKEKTQVLADLQSECL